jgi:hypothetical protein
MDGKQVLLNPKDIGKDPSTGKKCAMWYKELKIPFDFKIPECCFVIVEKGKQITTCVESKGVCIVKTFKLMKALWDLCNFGMNTKNDTKPSPDAQILGDDGYKPKITFNKDKTKYSVCPSLRETPIFQEGTTNQDYKVDPPNSIAYSNKLTLYQGYFNIYPVEMEKESSWQLLQYYGELTPEGFKFFENEKEFEESHKKKIEPKLLIRPDMLNMSCVKGSACFPDEFFQKLAKNVPELARLGSLSATKMELYEIKSENGCAVLENTVANTPNYFVVCSHIKNIATFDQNLFKKINSLTNYSEARTAISAYYGQIMRKIVYESYLIARKYLKDESLPELEDKIVSMARISMLGELNEYPKLTVTDQGIVSNSALVVKFDSVTNCHVDYNLAYTPKSYMYEDKLSCCIRFRGPKTFEYICVKGTNCNYRAYQLAKKFNEKCKNTKEMPDDDIHNEVNMGYNIKLYPVIKRVFSSRIKMSDINKLNTAKLSTEEYETKHRSLAIKYIYDMKQMVHDSGVMDIITSAQTQDSPTDNTPVEKVTDEVSGISPRYIGTGNEYKVTAADNRILQYENIKTNNVLNIVKNYQIVKAKEYSGLIGDDSKYILLVYSEGGQKRFFLVTDKTVELGDSIESMEDYSKLSKYEQYLKACGVDIGSSQAKNVANNDANKRLRMK